MGRLRLISTDFDGTIHEDFSSVPIPPVLESRIAALQSSGVTWVINTGREMQSLMESLGRARVGIRPDYLILVEREIYRNDHGHYVPIEPWNTRCHEDHARLFGAMAPELVELLEGLQARHDATFYDDPWSPLCVIARSNAQMDAIEQELLRFCATIPDLAVVRNDVYLRFSHRAYSKGTALMELQRVLGVSVAETLAAGDHFNDLSMLRRECAGYLVAPDNAMPLVKKQVQEEGGWIMTERAGHGVASALERAWGAGEGVTPSPAGT
jgi:hypothetical protein